MLEIAEFINPTPSPLWKLAKQAGVDLAVGGLPFDTLQAGEKVGDLAPLKRMQDRYTEGGFNYSRYCNEEVDALWQTALDEPDWDTAVPIWNEVSLALAETPAQATLYRSAVNYVWNDRVRGALPYQYRLPIRNPFERIWIAQD